MVGPSSSSGGFSVASIWDQIRKHIPEVAWWKLIWFSNAIPRCAFISWLAIRDRLSTKERLATRGIGNDTLCHV